MALSTTTLALAGGTPAHRTTAPTYPAVDPEALDTVADMLRAGPRQGLAKTHPVIGDLERRLAAFHEVEHCLAASSGHGALQSALIGLEITGGDEVVTSPYSWGASVSCILHNGALPVFADVSEETGLLDPASVEAAIGPRTRGILVPHIFGQPTDMTAIGAIASRHGVAVIEDGSQAHGARHRGRPVGSFGDASGFSTNGVKPIATTEGGYMVTRHADVYYKATISCQHAGRGEMLGRSSEPGFPDELRPYIDSLVYTYRPNLVSALLTFDRLAKLDEENAARRRQAALLREQLAGIGSVSMPDYHPDDEPAFHMVTLNFDPEHAGVSRDLYVRALRAEGVDAVPYVDNGLHRSPRLSPDWNGPRVMWTETIRAAGADPTRTELPGCDAKVARSIELPWNFPEADDAHVRSIAGAFAKVEESLGELRSLS